MRHALRTITAILSLASCGEASTGPYYATKSAAPTGLSVALQLMPAPGGVSDTVSITALGDSVSASALIGTSGCMDYSAVAGQIDGKLVITLVATPADRLCILVDTPSTVRAVVRLLAPGEYRVEYRKRIALPQSAPAERVLGRQSVRLP